jgi:hypothetical protein
MLKHLWTSFPTFKPTPSEPYWRQEEQLTSAPSAFCWSLKAKSLYLGRCSLTTIL